MADNLLTCRHCKRDVPKLRQRGLCNICASNPKILQNYPRRSYCPHCHRSDKSWRLGKGCCYDCLQLPEVKERIARNIAKYRESVALARAARTKETYEKSALARENSETLEELEQLIESRRHDMPDRVWDEDLQSIRSVPRERRVMPRAVTRWGDDDVLTPLIESSEGGFTRAMVLADKWLQKLSKKRGKPLSARLSDGGSVVEVTVEYATGVKVERFEDRQCRNAAVSDSFRGSRKPGICRNKPRRPRVPA